MPGVIGPYVPELRGEVQEIAVRHDAVDERRQDLDSRFGASPARLPTVVAGGLATP